MTMQQQPTVETSITFLSNTVELDFVELSRLMGCEPDSSRSLNQLTAAGRLPPIRSSEWTVSTNAQVVDSIDEGINLLFQRFTRQWTLVVEFCRRSGYEVSVTSRVRIYDWNDRPFVELGAPTIGRLRELGAKWQLDLVDLSR